MHTMNNAVDTFRFDIIIIVICALMAAAVFFLDVYVPPRFAVDALYSLIIVVSLTSGNIQAIRFFAWACTALLLVGYFISVSSILPNWLLMLNRMLFLLVIWITAILGMRLTQAQVQLRKNENELKDINQSLERMAHHDSLTGVANRRFFDDVLEAECERANRGETPLTLLMVDVDLFKEYNDIHGHLAGDECLQRIAWAIQDKLRRPSDMVARYGGEEFAVILPVTAEAGAQERAEDIRKTIEGLAIHHDNQEMSRQVTVSVGVACLWPHVQRLKPETIIGASDAALYRAKKDGRNCVRMTES
jgi:diguanylate cyclase (GGDEF)-like protein